MSTRDHTQAADAATRLRAAARTIDAHPATAGVDVLAPETSPHDTHTLEITLERDTCPPTIVRMLARERCALLEASPRGTGFHIVATA